MGLGFSTMVILVGTGVVYATPPPLAPQQVTPKAIAGNRAGLLSLCFQLRVLQAAPTAAERALSKRVDGFGPVGERARRAGLARFVLNPDGSYIDFYTVAAHYNTTAVRLCDDLVESEVKGGPNADQIPQADVM